MLALGRDLGETAQWRNFKISQQDYSSRYAGRKNKHPMTILSMRRLDGHATKTWCTGGRTWHICRQMPIRWSVCLGWLKLQVMLNHPQIEVTHLLDLGPLKREASNHQQTCISLSTSTHWMQLDNQWSSTILWHLMVTLSVPILSRSDAGMPTHSMCSCATTLTETAIFNGSTSASRITQTFQVQSGLTSSILRKPIAFSSQ